MDYQFFEVINGLAGKLPELDLLVRGMAVYGLLISLLVLLVLLWWPNIDLKTRRLQLFSTGLAMMLCSLLYFLEWLLISKHILPNELRARPANVQWVTLLVVPDSRMAFPSWPTLAIMALSMAIAPYYRFVSALLAVIALLTGIALVIAGVNYPFDVMTGMIVGTAIGATSAYVVLRLFPSRQILKQKFIVLLLWMVTVCWLIVMAFTIKPANYQEPMSQSNVQAEKLLLVVPPDKLKSQIIEMTGCKNITIQSASNGYMINALLVLIIPEAEVNRRRVHEVTREAVNALFANWPQLDLATVDVSMPTVVAKGESVGTLCRATISRTQWPSAGFIETQLLPGEILYSPRYQNLPK